MYSAKHDLTKCVIRIVSHVSVPMIINKKSVKAQIRHTNEI
jgi:hypothetical protein